MAVQYGCIREVSLFTGHQYGYIREVSLFTGQQYDCIREVVFYRSQIWLHCKGGSYSY